MPELYQCYYDGEHEMKHQMAHLFALPVYKASLERSFTEAETRYFQQQIQDPTPAISNQSSRNKQVLQAPPLSALRNAIQLHLDHYLRITFNPATEVELAITQSWLTRTRRGESHHIHTHPNSVVSGVLYINLGPGDGITFYRNEDHQWYELPRKEETYFSTHSYFFPTGVGDLILFPSHVKHGTHALEHDVERISLSFNTFFSGQLGRDDFSNGLHIRVD